MRKITLLLALALFAACNARRIPTLSFEEVSLPPAPDYTDSSAWSALPMMKDFADTVPVSAQVPEQQDSAIADVFFIHPTTFFSKKAWNADIHDERLNKKTDSRAIKHQASAFNAGGRVFAPRYRQMVLGGFYSQHPQDIRSRDQAAEIAYQDIKRAFKHYLQHYNQGRPVIIAGHSQGSFHGIRLVKEFFDGKPLQAQLVAAYLIGFPFHEEDFSYLPVCDSADQTACVIGWATFKAETFPKDELRPFYQEAVVVNPLNWQVSPTQVPETEHKGFLAGNYKTIRRHHVHAQAHDQAGILWVNKPLPFLPTNNYHIADINLFWVDIRENVLDRVEAFVQHLPDGSSLSSGK